MEQVAGKTISFATKVKDPKTFEQKYKTIDGKILTYTPHSAWVQTKGKQPQLLRNFASVPNPLINGSCCLSTLSDYMAYKSARRTGPGLRFLDIENPSAQRHPMFKEDASGLPVKLTQKEQQNSPSKLKATGKRTGGRPIPKTLIRGIEFQSDQRQEKERAAIFGSTTNSGSSTSKNLAPSPMRVNQKATPGSKQHQSKQLQSKPTRKLNRTTQSTLVGSLGNPIPINAVEDTLQSPTKKFSIDSPTDRQTSSHEMKTPDQTPPSRKNLIKEMGIHEKSPEYQACLTFLAAIRPKDQTSTTQIVDLVSPAESPEKPTKDLEVLSVMSVQNPEEANDFEENQEKGNKEEQVSAEKQKNSIQSHRDVKLRS